MKAHSVQNYIMSESKTSNCEYMFHCMNWVVVMIAKRDLERNFSILWDPELMKNADKHVQIDNIDVPCAERDS